MLPDIWYPLSAVLCPRLLQSITLNPLPPVLLNNTDPAMLNSLRNSLAANSHYPRSFSLSYQHSALIDFKLI
tara:strand:- start:114 stop:329 length:216 start_codon:yes stop_codon:yes gene_type:complete